MPFYILFVSVREAAADADPGRLLPAGRAAGLLAAGDAGLPAARADGGCREDEEESQAALLLRQS